MAYDDAYVNCPLCGEEHKIKHLDRKQLDIEEDFEGRDTLTFLCPEKKEKAKALVRRRR